MTISKKALAAVLVGLLVVAGAAYFALLSPKSSELSYTLAHASLASTETQTVHGEVTPAEGDRLVIVELRDSSGWSEAGRTITDSAGAFNVSFPMTNRGETDIRVRVEAEGRYRAVTASAKTVRVLEPTQLEAQIPKFARADRPLRIAGRVSPAGARIVHIETSTDGQNWTEIGHATARAASGQFSASATGLTPGTLQVRVSVEESGSSGEAIGQARSVSIEDYKAAGRHYLAIVKTANQLLTEWEAAPDDDFAQFQTIVAKLSKASTVQARQFRTYAFWPREVKDYISLLVKSDILYADWYNQMAHTDSFAEANHITAPVLPRGADNAAALTRAALGLPKRD